MASTVVAAVIVAACAASSPSDSDSAATTAPSTTEAPATTTTTVATATTEVPIATTPPAFTPPSILPPQPATFDRLVVSGPEEVVFDWTTDRCEDEHIPDIAARAYRAADGRVQLTIGHYLTYRMIGDDFDSLTSDCSQPQLSSDYDPDPAQFNDSEWIGAPYTLDGETVYAVIHNEYRGDTHGSSRPEQCPSGERLTCLDTSFTMAISTDGGATFGDIAPPPNHLIATLPYVYDDQGVPSGIRQPSNIVRGPDDYFYLFGNISSPPDEAQWLCAMRTNDLDDPSSWRYWDGDDFAGVWTNPYLEPDAGADTCAPLADPQLSGSLNESLIFDESIDRFVSIGVSSAPDSPQPRYAFYYSTSENLIDWSLRRFLLELPINNNVADPANDLVHAYPAFIDHHSTSPNFETSDGEFHLYISRFNAGGNSLDRDLLRWPVKFEQVEIEPPMWTFDTPGDDEGWIAEFGLRPFEVTDGVLSTESTADDPAMALFGTTVPADFDRLTIRMRVSEGRDELGQLFFGTEQAPALSESQSITFDVIGDGEFHDYVVDLGRTPTWSGTITTLRFDPVELVGRAIDIDSIILSAS